MREKLAKLVAAVTALVIGLAVLVFAWNQQSRMQQMAEHTDPQAWSTLYPLHVASFMRGAETDAAELQDRLAENPFRRRAWAGHAFELEYNAARAHYFAQIDQRQSRRTLERQQPAGCVYCHAAEAPALLSEYGWEGLNALHYDDISDQVHHGSTCTDCHAADTMELQITRPALINALQQQGIAVGGLSRQEMRSYVCAQCHVEYYFREPGQELIFPLVNGLLLEEIENYFDAMNFSDWEHAETGASLIKIQHPNFELHSQGVHADKNVSCADCHMPSVQEGGMRITDHGSRSPLDQFEVSCMGCHRGSAERLEQRTQRTQQNTVSLLANTENALSELMDAIIAARAAGASDEDLEQARQAHRSAQIRWDFIDADASKGFHAPQESIRLLSDAIEIARTGQRSLAERDSENTADN